MEVICSDVGRVTDRIRECAIKMENAYGRTVFDEWALVSLLPNKGRILHYTGPRREQFAGNFSADLAKLRKELISQQHGFGQFEFARDGEGSQFDAFMCVGEGVYLICNNLFATMEDITRDGRWFSAQVPFVEMSEEFRSNPLIYAA